MTRNVAQRLVRDDAMPAWWPLLGALLGVGVMLADRSTPPGVYQIAPAALLALVAALVFASARSAATALDAAGDRAAVLRARVAAQVATPWAWAHLAVVGLIAMAGGVALVVGWGASTAAALLGAAIASLAILAYRAVEVAAARDCDSVPPRP